MQQGVGDNFAVIIDRISQDVPFYRAYLKRAASSSELSTALTNIQSGATFGSVAAGVLATQEFYNNAVANTP